jgi:hypothetical protein
MGHQESCRFSNATRIISRHTWLSGDKAGYQETYQIIRRSRLSGDTLRTRRHAGLSGVTSVIKHNWLLGDVPGYQETNWVIRRHTGLSRDTLGYMEAHKVIRRHARLSKVSSRVKHSYVIMRRPWLSGNEQR